MDDINGDFSELDAEIRRHFGNGDSNALQEAFEAHQVAHDQSDLPTVDEQRTLLTAAGFPFVPYVTSVVESVTPVEEPEPLETVVSFTPPTLTYNAVMAEIKATFEENPNKRYSARFMMTEWNISDVQVKAIIRTLRGTMNITQEYGSYVYRTVAPKRGSRSANNRYIPPVLPTEELHQYGVILYELFEEHSEFVKGRNIVRGGTDDLLVFLPAAKRRLFMATRGKGIARYKLVQVHQYLTQIGAIEIAGPIKALVMHPNEIIDVGHPQIRPSHTTPAAPVSSPMAVAHVEEHDTEPDLIGQADPDHLAHALANGMWTRFEWAIGEVGQMRETVARLEEAVRVKDEEIARLRDQIGMPSVTEMARQLLS